MEHIHDHGAMHNNRRFAIGVSLNIAFVIAEIVCGLLAHSLALIADAGHNVSDVLGLLLAWGASILVRRRPTLRRTYGWRRSSILAALMNAVLLLIAIGAIAWEAFGRLSHPGSVHSSLVVAVALFAVIVNTTTALLFMSGRDRDLNVRGAFLHMAADAAVSLGVALAGIAIAVTGKEWLDPATSLLIVGVVLVATWGLLRDSVNLALDAVPTNIDARHVR
jgi:cobalt-zinc-cadmium efflux system protein